MNHPQCPPVYKQKITKCVKKKHDPQSKEKADLKLTRRLGLTDKDVKEVIINMSLDLKTKHSPKEGISTWAI